MQSTSSDAEPSLADINITKENLLQELRAEPRQVVILDCRSTNDYTVLHIRQAVNFSIPSLMLRRLSAGKIDLLSTIRNQELKEKIAEAYNRDLFVIYGDNTPADIERISNTNEVLNVLMRRLTQDGCRVACLTEGFTAFSRAYPEWCESTAEVTNPGADPVAAPLMGLQSLRISPSPPISYKDRYMLGSSCESSLITSTPDTSDPEEKHGRSGGKEEDKEFPVEILPNLFLGNAYSSGDGESLEKNNIQYILNVTADLPNVFENTGKVKYMKIPIADHWSENLARFFPKAIRFIEEARSNSKGVLVHCLAGVSRSVTVTMAYLMYKLNLSLNEAFIMVRNKKANIGPNFHFMEQLHTFEQELKIHGTLPDWIEDDSEESQNEGRLKSPKEDSSICGECSNCESQRCECKSSQFLIPHHIGPSPDSGIEFDRWASPSEPPQ